VVPGSVIGMARGIFDIIKSPLVAGCGDHSRLRDSGGGMENYRNDFHDCGATHALTRAKRDGFLFLLSVSKFAY